MKEKNINDITAIKYREFYIYERFRIQEPQNRQVLTDKEVREGFKMDLICDWIDKILNCGGDGIELLHWGEMVKIWLGETFMPSAEGEGSGWIMLYVRGI